MPASPIRDLPVELAALGEPGPDLRWTWSHEADALWERVDAAAWCRSLPRDRSQWRERLLLTSAGVR